MEGYQVNNPELKRLGLCSLLHPKAAQHNRPIDCGPAASHETTAAARTVNILPGSGFHLPEPPNAECQRANRCSGRATECLSTSVRSI